MLKVCPFFTGFTKPKSFLNTDMEILPYEIEVEILSYLNGRDYFIYSTCSKRNGNACTTYWSCYPKGFFTDGVCTMGTWPIQLQRHWTHIQFRCFICNDENSPVIAPWPHLNLCATHRQNEIHSVLISKSYAKTQFCMNDIDLSPLTFLQKGRCKLYLEPEVNVIAQNKFGIQGLQKKQEVKIMNWKKKQWNIESPLTSLRGNVDVAKRVLSNTPQEGPFRYTSELQTDAYIFYQLYTLKGLYSNMHTRGMPVSTAQLEAGIRVFHAHVTGCSHFDVEHLKEFMRRFLTLKAQFYHILGTSMEQSTLHRWVSFSSTCLVTFGLHGSFEKCGNVMEIANIQWTRFTRHDEMYKALKNAGKKEGEVHDALTRSSVLQKFMKTGSLLCFGSLYLTGSDMVAKYLEMEASQMSREDDLQEALAHVPHLYILSDPHIAGFVKEGYSYAQSQLCTASGIATMVIFEAASRPILAGHEAITFAYLKEGEVEALVALLQDSSEAYKKALCAQIQGGETFFSAVVFEPSLGNVQDWATLLIARAAREWNLSERIRTLGYNPVSISWGNTALDYIRYARRKRGQVNLRWVALQAIYDWNPVEGRACILTLALASIDSPYKDVTGPQLLDALQNYFEILESWQVVSVIRVWEQCVAIANWIRKLQEEMFNRQLELNSRLGPWRELPLVSNNLARAYVERGLPLFCGVEVCKKGNVFSLLLRFRQEQVRRKMSFARILPKVMKKSIPHWIVVAVSRWGCWTRSFEYGFFTRNCKQENMTSVMKSSMELDAMKRLKTFLAIIPYDVLDAQPPAARREWQMWLESGTCLQKVLTFADMYRRMEKTLICYNCRSDLYYEDAKACDHCEWIFCKTCYESCMTCASPICIFCSCIR